MGQYITISTCNLNQWALDFDGNKSRIIQSIVEAKAQKSKLRVGPELEICGYGCLDHFLENDLYDQCWDVYSEILTHADTQQILLDIGMPIIHKSIKYNCRVISYNGEILLIRPKLSLANDGNYREMRYFTPWRAQYWEEYQLPKVVYKLSGQSKVTFGDCVIQTLETRLGCETCEELFTPNSPHIQLALDGVEIFTNSSGSHHELRKLDTRMNLITSATKKCGGIYLYSNQKGCDGDRLYYDGSASIIVNGQIVAQASQFSLLDVEVISATIDLDDVRAYRNQRAANIQAAASPKYKTIESKVELSPLKNIFDPNVKPTLVRPAKYHTPEEEIALGPACWLWDYLRRSKCGGYFLPLSGGIDSCATATIVHLMCRLVVEAIENGNKQVLEDIRSLTHDPEFTPTTPQQIASRLFYSSFMGTENSSKETRQRAKDLAAKIGAYHVDMNMDTLVSAVITVFEIATGKRPIFKIFGGSQTENLALQNIQARLRMVLSYLFAQLLPWTRDPKNAGGLLVLGSANVDECLRGYLTKYDCSSADVNPIGGISKTDLKRFISWAEINFELPILNDFITAVPTAELEPITENYVQSDEIDMGMSYDELSRFGRLRKVEKCGPVAMFVKLYHEWSQPPLNLTAEQVAEKVKRFWFFYAINRHKMTTMTPAYHAEQYSPDDNRFDLRPFLINPRFPLASRKIDDIVRVINEEHESRREIEESNVSVD